MKLAFLVATAAALATSVFATPTDSATTNATVATSTARRLGGPPGMWYLMLGVDVVGKDTTSWGNMRDIIDCFSACYEDKPAANKKCSAVTWTPYAGGTCYFKGADFKNTETVAKSDADSYVIRYDTEEKVAIVSATAIGYDMPGNDLSITEGDINKCRNDCVANKKCYAVVRTEYNGGTCWLKTRASTLVPKAGSQAAFLGRQTRYLSS